MTMTRSERAFDLLERLLKHTEPGGVFSNTLHNELESTTKTREDFIAEVIGVITAKTPGEVPIESRLNTAQLALRAITAEIKRETLGAVVEIVSKKHPAEALVRLAESAATTMEIAALALHVTGVPDNLIGVEPSEAEIKADSVRGCNCDRCRKSRIKK